MLSAAAGALFERTADMSDEAVVTLLGALHLVSAASLPAAALQPGNTKCLPPFPPARPPCFPRRPAASCRCWSQLLPGEGRERGGRTAGYHESCVHFVLLVGLVSAQQRTQFPP